MREVLKEQEFIAIYQSTVDSFFSTVYRWCRGDRTMAEDVVQETYLRALTDWRKNGLPKSPSTWLRAVARNLLVNHHRRHRTEPIDQLEPVLGVDPVDLAVRERTAHIVWALSRLRLRYRSLIRDFYLEGKSVREIANEKDSTERAIEGRLRRGRQALKQLLKPLLS